MGINIVPVVIYANSCIHALDVMGDQIIEPFASKITHCLSSFLIFLVLKDLVMISFPVYCYQIGSALPILARPIMSLVDASEDAIYEGP